MERIGKGLAIILSLVLAGGLAFSILQERNENREIQRKAAQLEKELSPLELERNRLQQELATLKNEYKEELKGDGSFVLLFTDLSESIYTEIFPKMKNYGFTGILTISHVQYPGQEGCLSTEQFKSLMDAGWFCCLKWEEDAEQKEWLRDSREMVRVVGTAEPKAVYFPEKTYSSDLDSFFTKEKFTAAVHHGEGDFPLVATEAGEGLWHPGAIAWNQPGAEQMLEEAALQGGNIVFTVGSDSEQEQYTEEAFANMLWQVKKYCDEEGMLVCSLSEALEYRREVGEEDHAAEEGYKEQRRSLEEEIEGLEEEMERITGEYMR